MNYQDINAINSMTAGQMHYPEDDVPTNNYADDSLTEVLELENKVRSSTCPDSLKDEAMRAVSRLKRMAKMGSYGSEFENVNKYIDWITRIPWGIVSNDNLDIQNAKQNMDASHYGMNSIKDLILDYLATMQLENANNVIPHSSVPTQVQQCREIYSCLSQK